jgi:oligopeptide transport system ATP-binding protein
MRQRIMIAMAISLSPQLLIADEPTTALDVTVQAQIMELLADLRAEFGMSLLFVTHDLGVVAPIADRVAVMYGGRIVETGPIREVYDSPRHPYTAGLLASLPDLSVRRQRLTPIPGNPPNPVSMPAGCAFSPRCAFATQLTRESQPELVEVGAGHSVACHRREELVLQLKEVADGYPA